MECCTSFSFPRKRFMSCRPPRCRGGFVRHVAVLAALLLMVPQDRYGGNQEGRNEEELVTASMWRIPSPVSMSRCVNKERDAVKPDRHKKRRSSGKGKSWIARPPKDVEVPKNFLLTLDPLTGSVDDVSRSHMFRIFRQQCQKWQNDKPSGEEVKQHYEPPRPLGWNALLTMRRELPPLPSPKKLSGRPFVWDVKVEGDRHLLTRGSDSGKMMGDPIGESFGFRLRYFMRCLVAALQNAGLIYDTKGEQPDWRLPGPKPPYGSVFYVDESAIAMAFELENRVFSTYLQNDINQSRESGKNGLLRLSLTPFSFIVTDRLNLFPNGAMWAHGVVRIPIRSMTDFWILIDAMKAPLKKTPYKMQWRNYPPISDEVFGELLKQRFKQRDAFHPNQQPNSAQPALFDVLIYKDGSASISMTSGLPPADEMTWPLNTPSLPVPDVPVGQSSTAGEAGSAEPVGQFIVVPREAVWEKSIKTVEVMELFQEKWTSIRRWMPQPNNQEAPADWLELFSPSGKTPQPRQQEGGGKNALTPQEMYDFQLALALQVQELGQTPNPSLFSGQTGGLRQTSSTPSTPQSQRHPRSSALPFRRGISPPKY